MNTGTVISGIGHAALVAWALLGGVFEREPDLPEIEATDVSIISVQEFEVLTASTNAPETVSEAPSVAQPATPQLDQAAAPSSDQAPELPSLQSETEAPALPDTTPEMAALVPPPPDSPIEDTAPEAPTPPAPPLADAPERPDLPPSPEAAPRIAALPQPEPPADAVPDDIVREEAEAEAESETLSEETETTAPEETTTEIVTEADEPAGAPEASPRPPTRPSPPVQTAEPEPEETPTPEATAEATPEPEPEQPSTEDAVTAALAEALQPEAEPSVPAGPPLTAAEKEALRLRVGRCWNLGSSSTDAQRTVVVVLVSMSREGRPERIEFLSSNGATEDATRIAFDAARRAVLRCGAQGYDLPPEKYAQWREIEMTFNPEEMRRR